MGWFWADSAPSQPIPPHPLPRGNAEPPVRYAAHRKTSPAVANKKQPSCPMHKPSQKAAAPANSSKPTECPYQPPSPKSKAKSGGSSPSYVSKLNPLNYMPDSISNERQSAGQSVKLPLDREASSIPRGDGTGNWEYPSPQQMYNAMLRKGYTDTPAEHVESMVAVHNFLNEGAWEEIKEWERRFSGGLSRGWELCRHGEEGAARQAALDAIRRNRRGERQRDPKLVRFMGRPNEPTPKARMHAVMAWLYPAQYSDNPPFDRHDWYVQRQLPNGQEKEVRYVIDYYSGPPEPTGEPVFYLDVRPAVDGPAAACERLMRWGGDVWYRASGGSVREAEQKQKQKR